MADPVKYEVKQIVRTNCATYSRVYYPKAVTPTNDEASYLYLVTGKRAMLRHPTTGENILFFPGVYFGKDFIDAITSPITWDQQIVSGKLNALFEGSVSAQAFYQSSDINKKTNVREVSDIDSIDDIEIVEFDWKDSGELGVGVIAQDVQKVRPELVHQDTDGSLNVSYIELLLLKIKRLEDKVEYLTKQINDK